MAKETQPRTYRISLEVDEQLRHLAKIHGGVDKALRLMLSAGGVFGKGLADLASVQQQADRSVELVRKHMEQSSVVPQRDRKPLLKPRDRK